MAAVQYGVLPQIPDVLSSLMCAETNIEDACRDLLQMLASPLAEKSPSHVQSLLHHQGPLAGKGSSHIPFLYDQGPLAGKCSPSLTYSIKRLLRGLAAISLHTKTNYASALFCILSHFKDTLDAKVIVTWAKGALQKNKEYAEHRLSTTEENALLAGRLITYSIFVAVLPLDLEDLLELLSDSYRIWTDHDHLCTLAISSISDIITYADQRARPLQLLTSLLPKCKCQIKKSTLIMTIRSLFDADFADDYELNLSDVSVRLSLLNEIDMDRIDSPKNYALFRSLMIFETSTVDMHETCWTEITSKLLCTPKPGIPLLQNLLDDLLYLKSAHFDQLLTESVLEGLVKDQQFTSTSTFRYALTSDAFVIKLVKLCINSNPQPELSALKSVDHRRLFIALDKLQNFEWHHPHCTTRIADLHLYLLSNECHVSNSKEFISRVMLSLMNYTLGNSDEKLSSRVQGALFRILSNEKLDSVGFVQWLTELVEHVDKYYNLSTKEGKYNFKKLDEPVRDAWPMARALQAQLKKMNLISEMTEVQVYYQVIHLMVLSGRLLLVLDPLASVSIFEDLNDCLDHLQRPTEIKSDLTPVEVLLDILIQWQSRSTAFLRALSNELFIKLIPYLTEECFASIFRVITTSYQQERDLLEEENWSDGDDVIADPLTKRSEFALTKRPRLDLPEPNPSSTDESDTDGLSEVVNLEEADACDLELLDQQLSAIMTARKQEVASKALSRQHLAHFKQRIVDWLPAIIQHTPNKDNFIVKARMIPTFLEFFKIHSLSKDRAHDPKFKFEGDLLLKMDTLYKSFYCQAPTKQPIILTSNDETLCINTLQAITDLIQLSVKVPSVVHRASSVFVFLLSGLKDHQDDLFKIVSDLWCKILVESNKSHDASLISFFDCLKQSCPKILLTSMARAESLDVVFKARNFTRHRVFAFFEQVLKSASRESNLQGELKAFFLSLIGRFEKSLCEDGELADISISVFREMLGHINSFVAKSRHSLNDDAFSAWKPVFDRILNAVTAFKEACPPNQISALNSKVVSMMAMVQAK